MMTLIRNWCMAVGDMPSSIALRESSVAYPATETVHVVMLILFLGLVVMMDLRLAGIGNKGTPITQIQKRLFPWQMAGMAIISISGAILVFADPMRFYGNLFFRVKLVLLGLAGINALTFHFTTYNSVAAWDTDPKPPFGARLAGGVSLAIWSLIVVTGRLIAYNWFEPIQ